LPQGTSILRLTKIAAAAWALSAAVVATASAADEKLGTIIPTMTMVYYAPDAGQDYQQSARVLAEAFEKLGLDIKMTPLQQSTMVARISIGKGLEDLALGSWGGDPDRMDPNFWVLSLTACNERRNAVKWCDEEYTKIAQDQARTMDQEKRRALVWKLQEIAHEKAPWWLVSHRMQGILYNSDRWDNIKSSEPVPPHETVVEPWLKMRPKGDDRIVDWAYYEDVSTYNPLAEQTSQGWIRFVYDSYLRTEGSKIVPWAVTSWKTVDDTTVELKLRDGMTFHDDKPVTADDAVFSINLMVKLKPPPLANGLVGISGAEKVDNLTFRIKLSQPNPAIGRQLTALTILPKHIWEKVEDPLRWDPIANKGVIGSGPFAFVRWDRNQAHVLRTHKKHWAAPAYDGLRRLSLGQADAIRAAMLDGAADVATSTLPVATQKELAENNKHLGFMPVKTFTSTTVWVNHTKAPFNDLAFRKALRSATDRERVALEGWLGFADPAAEGIVPAILGDWHNPNLKKIPFDIAKARQTLKEAGYGWDSNGRLHFPPGKP